MKGINVVNLIVYSVVTAVLAVTTFLSPSVYGTWWFVALWGVFALVLIISITISKMWNDAGRLILHISLLAILGGGVLTWQTQTEGFVRIAPGETVEKFIGKDGKLHSLPKPLRLERFETEYYPGGVVPRDYISHLTIDEKGVKVSMNNILDIDGFRLLQYSYDGDGSTVLAVNHDPYGIVLSYAGYILFAIGGLMLLLEGKGKFRRLLKSVAGCLILLSFPAPRVQASSINGIPRESADSMRSQQVLYNGKLVTINTLSRDVMLKIYGKTHYRGLSPEQTLLSLKLFPDQWKNEPLILIKEKAVADALSIKGKYARLSDLFDSEGNYKVERLYSTLGRENVRAVENLDEKTGIILTLLSGQLIEPRPEGMPPLSGTRVKAELLYNSIPFTKLIFIMLFIGFFAGMTGHFAGAKSNTAKGKDRKAIARRASIALLTIATLLSAILFAFQWYLSGRIPVANTFETLQFVVLIIELLLLAAGRRDSLLLPLGMLMAGALALVAHLVATNPVVTQLMPVLHSGWLALHVTLVMTSYAILGFTFVTAATGIFVPASAERMRRLSTCMLYPGVYLLGLGIFTGAVWANVSWGQYWSWDPKETWALITLLVYALPLHRSMAPMRSARTFHIYMLAAVLSIAMTYFGVNHLDSLHAYN